MRAPDSFTDQLSSQFHNRFRLRWSDKRQEFHLEQKVFTGQVMEPPPIDPESGHFDTYSDEWIRARDGYFYVMTIRAGDRMPCPICHSTLKVPVMETREMWCDECRKRGNDGRYVAAFYPLGEVLLDHLRDIDPQNGGPQRARQRMRAKQVERMAREVKEPAEVGGLMLMDDKYQAELRPMVGYGPKTAQRGEAGIGGAAALRDRMK
jgi:hypothetical protein